jgi:predicted RNA-binding Zn-ribbon protein involved in translation (DUF1610 family)
MRIAAMVAVLFASAVGWAGIAFNPSVQFSFPNCSSSGSAAQTVTAGDYLLTVDTEKTWLCETASASTCASNGVSLPAPTVMVFTVPNGGRSISCRSSASTGNLQLTQVSY